MKKYVFELIVTESNTEFWEDLAKHGNTGCDELLEELRAVLDNSGFDPIVKLVTYSDQTN